MAPRIAGLAIAALVLGCVARPPIASPPAGPTGTPDAPARSEEPSESILALPRADSAPDWHAAVVLPADKAAFQRAIANQGPLAAGRTVWQITADGAFIPADPIGTAERFGVIGGPAGFVDWDTPGIVRWSPDGLTWFDDPSGPISANLSMIVPTGDRLLLVGDSTGARVGAWFSDDGRSWSEALGAPPALWSAVEWTGRGIVAAGGSGPSTAVWSNPDGSAWRSVAAPGPGLDSPTIAGLAAGPSGVVAIGDVDGRAAAWRTTDLRHWTEAGPAWGRDALLETVTRIGETFFIAGRRSGRPVLWVSTSGLAWSAVDLPFAPGLEGEVALVVEIHRQPIAFGYTTEDAGNGGWSRRADLVWALGRWPTG